MKYICSKCGQEHEGRPSIAFDSPHEYRVLSEKEKETIATLFKDYVDNYDNADHEATYFGYLCNRLADYRDTLSIKTNVVLRGKIRPEVIPHDDQLDNDFVRDYYEGISKETADGRVAAVLGL